MDLGKLPDNSVLRKLLAGCQYNHEIARTIAHDGAIIIECYECPWKRVLDEEEENVVRGTYVPIEAVTSLKSNPTG